jgi:hypothetical protein
MSDELNQYQTMYRVTCLKSSHHPSLITLLILCLIKTISSNVVIRLYVTAAVFTALESYRMKA